jgi:hypothetical protein
VPRRPPAKGAATDPSKNAMTAVDPSENVVTATDPVKETVDPTEKAATTTVPAVAAAKEGDSGADPARQGGAAPVTRQYGQGGSSRRGVESGVTTAPVGAFPSAPRPDLLTSRPEPTGGRRGERQGKEGSTHLPGTMLE